MVCSRIFAVAGEGNQRECRIRSLVEAYTKSMGERIVIMIYDMRQEMARS
jgi:hypothetical protein